MKMKIMMNIIPDLDPDPDLSLELPNLLLVSKNNNKSRTEKQLIQI